MKTFPSPLVAILLLLSGSARGGGAVEAIEISTDPPLATVAAHDGHQMRQATGASTVQLTIIARYADGTTADVTDSPGTTYQALSPNVGVTPTGRVQIDDPRVRTAAAIRVDHGGIARMFGFEVIPR